MTIRSQINAVRRKTLVFTWSAFLLFIIGLFLSQAYPVFISIGVLGFLGFMSGVFFLLFGIRCPQCKGQIGYAIIWPPGRLFTISKKIKFCPFCGVDIDSEIQK